jgi:hypothetical protein
MSNEIRNNVIVAVATAVILGVVGWAAGVFQTGQDALDEAKIEEVVKRSMVTDSGQTYGQLLDSTDKSVGEMNVLLGVMQEDIADLETSVGILSDR